MAKTHNVIHLTLVATDDRNNKIEIKTELKLSNLSSNELEHAKKWAARILAKAITKIPYTDFGVDGIELDFTPIEE